MRLCVEWTKQELGAICCHIWLEASSVPRASALYKIWAHWDLEAECFGNHMLRTYFLTWREVHNCTLDIVCPMRPFLSVYTLSSKLLLFFCLVTKYMSWRHNCSVKGRYIHRNKHETRLRMSQLDPLTTAATYSEPEEPEEPTEPHHDNAQPTPKQWLYSPKIPFVIKRSWSCNSEQCHWEELNWVFSFFLFLFCVCVLQFTDNHWIFCLAFETPISNTAFSS